MWVVLGLVVVLVAGGVVAWWALRDGGDGPATPAQGGVVADDAACSGDYCLGKYRYVNACGLLDPSSTAAAIGPIGNDGLLVQESYADPLPEADPKVGPTRPFVTRSSCDIRPVDSRKAAFRSLSVQLEQYAEDGVAQDGRTGKGRSLPGVADVVVQDGDGGAEVFGVVRNTRFRLNLSWGNKNPAIPDSTLATVVGTVVNGVANGPSEAADLGELRQAGRPVVTDACDVFTGADFQDAVDYAVDPTNVDRTYHTTMAGPLTRTCRRTTAPRDRERPAPEGTTYMDGAMAPKVTVTLHPDDAAARAAVAEDRRGITAAADIPGLGDGAVFGVDNSAFVLVFTRGFHQVRVDCGLTNGNANWTPADMRARLEPVAAAIAARMP